MYLNLDWLLITNVALFVAVQLDLAATYARTQAGMNGLDFLIPAFK